MIVIVSWKVLCQLAPWLLLGMVLSGAMHVFLPTDFIRKKFTGAWGVVKAVLFGVPLPLCSCGVIPAGIGLKNQGASTGAAVGFLISTPQTGIDSILVSASFFGWPFAVFKMAAAAITGVVGGWLSDWVETEPDTSELQAGMGQEKIGVDQEADWIPGESPASHGGEPLTIKSRIVAIWVHGEEIMHSIWAWMLIGILVSAVIEVYVPQQWFQMVGQWGLVPAMFVVLLMATPLYVCATASVPIAAALVTGGLPPAAALVFLMAGPATNVTTMGAIHTRFGWKTLVVYLLTIVFGSMAFAAVFDWLLTANVAVQSSHEHDHQNGVSIVSAVILLAMIGRFVWQDIVRWIRKRSERGADSPRIEITIVGMTCGGCVNRIESAIQACNGVESVTVELKSGLATIVGNANEDELVKVIRSLGFRAADRSD